MADIFERLIKNYGPIGQHRERAHGYFAFPKLEGEIGSKMKFRGQEMIVWSLNNYLGLANHPEVRKADADASAQYGLALPMGARMMSGNSDLHEQLERELAEFVHKEDSILMNYGYQGIMSAIDAICGRHDVVVYDAECHACIIDALRMIPGHRFVFKHNDVEDCEKQLLRAQALVDKQQSGGVLVITEGVFGMAGDQGRLKEIAALKKKVPFRLLVDDAHGFGTLGKTGAGAGEEQGCQDEIDLYFSTFAKSMAAIGAFIAAPKEIIMYLKYNMRSQTYAKALPMPFVIGGMKRLELIKKHPELRETLWANVRALQKGLKEKGFDIGETQSPVTPVFLHGEYDIAAVTKLVRDLRENMGIFCSIVVYPVVPKGQIMLRIIPTSSHTIADIEYTCDCFAEVQKRLKSGYYAQ